MLELLLLLLPKGEGWTKGEQSVVVSSAPSLLIMFSTQVKDELGHSLSSCLRLSSVDIHVYGVGNPRVCQVTTI